MPNKLLSLVIILFINHAAKAQCMQKTASGEWLSVDCPNNYDCGEKDPAKYPWVVLTYKQGKYDGMNDYKSQETAKQQMKFWEHFNNVSWPKFSNTEFNLYRFYGPFRKCNFPIPFSHLTKSKGFEIVRPYLYVVYIAKELHEQKDK